MPRAEVSAPSNTPPAVVIDNGSGLLKAGFAGEDDPRVLLPPASLAGVHPFRNGVVQDWDAMEQCWDHAFTQLGVDVAVGDRPRAADLQPAEGATARLAPPG